MLLMPYWRENSLWWSKLKWSFPFLIGDPHETPMLAIVTFFSGKLFRAKKNGDENFSIKGSAAEKKKSNKDRIEVRERHLAAFINLGSVLGCGSCGPGFDSHFFSLSFSSLYNLQSQHLLSYFFLSASLFKLTKLTIGLFYVSLLSLPLTATT